MARYAKMLKESAKPLKAPLHCPQAHQQPNQPFQNPQISSPSPNSFLKISPFPLLRPLDLLFSPPSWPRDLQNDPTITSFELGLTLLCLFLVAAMSFFLGLVLGVAVGVGLIIAFVRSENSRSKRRTELVLCFSSNSLWIVWSSVLGFASD